MSNVPEPLLVESPIMETRRRVQLEPCSSHCFCVSEEKNLSLNKYCPPIFKNLNNRCAGVKPEVHCDGKVHEHGSPTQAPGNRSARLRDLDPEQRGVHYPHSTTTERLVSIVHPLPVMRLAVTRGAVKSFQCVSLLMCASLRFSTESRLLWSERFTDTLSLSSAAWCCVRSTRPEKPATSFAFLQPLPCMEPQPIRAKEESFGGGTKAVKVVRRVNEIVNA